MSLQVHGLAVGAGPERLVDDVDQHRARERVGDDERRRGEIVRPHVRVDPALEVAVAGEHRADHEVVVVDGLRDLRDQRPGIADAGAAAEADEIESERVEVLLEIRLPEVLGDHLGARGGRGLHPWLRLQALPDGVAGQKSGADHHARIRGVGAGRDRGEHHVAVAEIVVGALDLVRAGRARRPCGTPRPSRSMNSALASSRGTRSCGRFGPAREGRTSARSSSSVSVKTGSGVSAVRHMPWALRIGLDERDALGRAARRPQILHGLLIDREEAAGGAVFRGHVADGGAIRDGHVGEAGAVELDELADDALLAQHLRHGEHQVGGGDALAQLARQLEADHLRDEHGDRLAEHRGLRLDAADAPAEHREAVHHGGVRIGADQRVGVGDLGSRPPRSCGSRRSATGTPG